MCVCVALIHHCLSWATSLPWKYYALSCQLRSATCRYAEVWKCLFCRIGFKWLRSDAQFVMWMNIPLSHIASLHFSQLHKANRGNTHVSLVGIPLSLVAQSCQEALFEILFTSEQPTADDLLYQQETFAPLLYMINLRRYSGTIPA